MPIGAAGGWRGACLCGAVRITVDGAHVAAVGVCHCSLCQRSSGLVWGAFEASADAVTVGGTVARYASTPFSERAFCPVCGSNLWLRNTDTEGADYELMPALFCGGAGLSADLGDLHRPRTGLCAAVR